MSAFSSEIPLFPYQVRVASVCVYFILIFYAEKKRVKRPEQRQFFITFAGVLCSCMIKYVVLKWRIYMQKCSIKRVQPSYNTRTIIWRWTFLNVNIETKIAEEWENKATLAGMMAMWWQWRWWWQPPPIHHDYNRKNYVELKWSQNWWWWWLDERRNDRQSMYAPRGDWEHRKQWKHETAPKQ